MNNTLIKLLKTKRFFPLFITQFLGAFNDNAFKNAFLIWFTYDAINTTGISTPAMITIAGAVFILPYLFFSATAGQLADNNQKHILTKTIKKIEILLMICCSIAFMTGSIYALLALLFLMGVQSTFFGPIKFSLLPEHLKKQELLAGNSLIEAGTFLSILIGTIYGGLIIRVENGIAIFSFSVILFSISGWVSSLFIPETIIGDKKSKPHLNIIRETKNVLLIAKSNTKVWTSIIGISWFWLLGATFLTQLPLYTKTVLNGNETVVTSFLALFTIGIAIGSLICARFSKGQINGDLIPWGLSGMSLSIFIFWISSSFYTPVFSAPPVNLFSFIDYSFISYSILLSLFFLAFFAGIYVVPLYTLMQHYADEKYMARIIASNNILNALYMVISSLIILIMYYYDMHVTDILGSIALFNLFFFWLLRTILFKNKE